MSVGSAAAGAVADAMTGQASGAWGRIWRRPLAALLVMLAAMIGGALTTTANAVTCSGAGATDLTGYHNVYFNIASQAPGGIADGTCAVDGATGGSYSYLLFEITSSGGNTFSQGYFFGNHNNSRIQGTLTAPGFTVIQMFAIWSGTPVNGIYDFTAAIPVNGVDYVGTVRVQFLSGGYRILSASILGGTFGALPPTLSAISPTAGPLAGGQTVTLTGTNLTGATAVTIGGTAATSLTVVNDTTVTAVTPSGTAGAKSVVITTPGGNATLTNGYTYVAAPSLSALSPDKGTHAGGTSVTLTGNNLTGATAVTFNGVAAASFTVNSATSITAVSPPGLAGVKTVAVVTPGGSANRNFIYEATVTSVMPAFGPVSGGTSITVTGSGFTGLTGLSITTPDLSSNADATAFTVVNDSTITAVTPAMSADARVLGLKSPFSLVSYTQVTSAQFTHVVAPTLSAISPTSGSTAGGQTVTLTGTNLTGATAVTIGGVAATAFTVNSATQITATTPAGTAGAKDVVVTTAGGNATLTNGYTYVAAPTLASISPSSGILIGGQTVTLTGTNLTGATAVTIGGTAATSVTVVNDTTVTAVTPAGTAGAKNVVITTPGGSATLTNGFTYAAPPLLTGVSPSTGPTSGGQTITLTGTNLTGATVVTIIGVQATNVTVVNSTTVTAVTPALPAGTFNVTIGTPGGAHVLGNAYTAVAPPTLTAVSPGGGPAAGGNGITITGTNFTLGSTVTIGGAAVTSLALINSTTFTGIAPAGAAGAKDVVVTTPGGSATLTNGYIHLDAPTITAIAPNAGPLAGGQSVTITGTNFINVPGGNINGNIGGVALTGLVVVNDTTITAVTPASTAGAKNVRVGTAGGNATLTNGYTYVAAPTLTFLAPSGGPTAGGNLIEVNGTNLTGATSVTFDGVAATNLTQVSATRVTVLAPPGAAGTADIAITTPGGTATLTNGFTYFAPPTLTSVSPNVGPTAGGQSVILTGTNFDTGANGVRFGTQNVPYAINSATQITATAPAASAGTVDVSVTGSYGEIATLAGAYTFVAPPTLTAISPSAGPLAGGTAVTLTGTNFVPGDTSVAIGGTLIPAGSVTVNSATSLTFTTPANPAGNVAVIVTTSGGASNVVPGGFTYLNAPTTGSLSPNFGTSAGGTSVTISGTNFIAGDTSVTIGGTLIPAGSVTVNSATSLTFTSPANAAGNVAVTVATSGGASNTVPGGYTYVDAPTVTAAAPTAGPVAGGTSVTLTGTNFIAGNTSVTIGATVIPAGSVTVNSAASLTFTTPANAAGTVAISVTTPGGTSGDVPGGFTYMPVPAVSAVSPAAGPPAGGNTVTITGTGFTVMPSSVTIGGAAATGIVRVSSTQLTVTVPAGTAGPKDVTVTTPGGSGTLVAGYTYGVPLLALTAGDLAIEGDEGGAGGWTVSSATTTYTVSNSGSDTLTWSATLPSFVTATPLSGTLAPGGTVTFTPVPNSAADALTPGVYTGAISVTSNGGAETRNVTLTVRDATDPQLVGMPADFTETVVAPATTAAVTWTPPTATDNMPGVAVTQIAGLAPGSAFPLGVTTNTYRATDAAGNTAEASFTVTVNQIAQGTLTLNVETGEDGAFGFTSSAPGATTTLNTSGGLGTTGPIGIPAGSYSLSFTVPEGFAVTSATCTAGSTLSPVTQSGTITITPATSTVCTISAEDALGETAAVLGAHLETRASLILQNAPEVTRRLDRLTGSGGTTGGISSFGVTMGAGVLPFSMNLAADEVRFSMSLLGASRAEAGRLMPSRSARLTGGIADPLGDSLFGMADDRLVGAVSTPAHDKPIFGAATGGTLPVDPMAPRFDLWVEGRFARFDTPGGDGHFAIIHLGADYLVTPNVLIGAAVQFDWLEEDTALGGTIDSQGFLAGPYVTARLAENLFLDLRAAWGTADADVSPYGTYVDGVESSRSLFSGALIGDFEDGALRIRPEARLTWYREETDAYVDGFGVPIPGFTVETGFLEFGPELAYAITLEDGATILPSLSVQGVWTFAQENTAAAPSNAPGLADTGLRGRAELGVAYQRPGFSLAIATYYDGIGDDAFEAWGGRLRLNLGF